MTQIKITAAASLLLASSAFGATPALETGFYAAGETLEAPALHAPAHVSRTMVKTVTLSGGRAAVEVPARGGSGLIVWTITASPIGKAKPSASLRTPSGAVLRADEKQKGAIHRFALDAGEAGLELPDGQEVLYVPEAEAGSYVVELAASDDVALMVVAAEPESDLVLGSWAGPLSRQPGEPVTLTAELREGEAALSGARVTARLMAPHGAAGEAIELFDDGAHGDGAASDGVYAAIVDLPNEAPGHWTARFSAEGTDAAGRAFHRTSSGGFVSEKGAARLLPGSVTANVVTRDGASFLRVEAAALVATPGDFRLDVLVGGAADGEGVRPGVAWGELTRKLTKGRDSLSVEIPLPGDPAAARHVDVRLLNLDDVGVAGRSAIDLP